MTTFLLRLLLPFVAIAWAGCDRAWQAYNRVPMVSSQEGGPRPYPDWQDIPPEAQKCPFGKAFSQGSRTAVPLSVRHGRMAYLDGAHGVFAKAYRSTNQAWWLLMGTMSVRTVVEVDVPPEWFVEPPDDWQPATDWQNAPYIVSQIQEQTGTPEGPPREISVNRKDMASAEAAVDFAIKILNAKDPQKPASAGPRNAGRYVLACWLVMEGMHDNFNHHPEAGMLSGIVERPGWFKGITRSGYDRQWRNDDAWSGIYRHCRVRNVGGRRIRMEIAESGGFFPTSYFGYGTVTVNSFTGYAFDGTKVAW